LRTRAAEASRRVGDIRQRLGQYDRAEAAYLRAVGLYTDLAAATAGREGWPGLAETYNELSRTYRLQRRLEEARQASQQALAALGSAPADVAAQPAGRFQQARAYYSLGVRFPPDPGARPAGPRSGGPPRPPPPEGFAGAASRPFPRGGPPPSPPDRPDGPGAFPPGGPQRQYLEKAVAILKELAQGQGGNPEYRRLLALCYRESPPPAGGVDAAIQILEQLVREFPQESDYLFDLGETYAMGEVRDFGPARDSSAAIQPRLAKALTISQQLVAHFPNVPQYSVFLAQTYHRLGESYRRSGKDEPAHQSARKAVEVQTALVEEFPQAVQYKVWLAAFRNSLAEALLLRDNVQEARALLEETISQASQLLKDNPGLWYLHALLADSHRTLAAALRRGGQADLAGAAEQAAEEYRRQLPFGRASTRPARQDGPPTRPAP
jgi:tetratricopeptide (TPR) repeat protein